METLQLSKGWEPGVLTIKLDGRLDGNTSSDFGRYLAAEFETGDNVLVIDAEGLEFVSSAGLREFVLLAKTAAKRGTEVAIVGMRPGVREILEISGMIALFKVADSAEAAVRMVGGGAGGLLGRLFPGRGAK